MQNPRDSKTDINEEFYNFMMQQIKTGANKETIVARLIEAGTPSDRAYEVVEAVYPLMAEAAQQERPYPRSAVWIGLAVVVAAIIVGIMWAIK